MSDLKEYIVTAKTMADADSIIADMESSGGALYIPNRIVDITQLRELSRNTHFMLTDEEAVQLRNDSRVIAVERPPREIGIEVVHHWTQSGNFEKSLTIDTNDKNWGLYRVATGATLAGWGTDGSFTQSTQTVTTTSSGKNVDVVVVDAHINPLHPEFAVNIDGTGGSRVNQYNWFALSSIVGVNTVGTYDYSNISSNHGTHVAGTVAGNTQGWARDAAIYNMEFDYAGANAPANWELYIFDYLRAFHKNKDINPATGRRNPTVTNHSWGYSYGNITLASITGVTFRGAFTDISALSTANKRISLEQNGVPVPYSTYLYRMPYTYPALNADVADAIADGVIVVAAAGNSYWNSAYSGDQDYNNSIRSSGVDYVHSRGSSPAVAPGVIVVGNVSAQQAEYKNSSSNFGNRVDIWAPGTNIISAVYDTSAAAEFTITLVDDPRNSSYKIGSISGTSMASPQVCGTLACLAEQNPNLIASEALAYLIENSKKNQIGSTGSSWGNYQWFGDNGNNRYLFYKLERPISGQTLPRNTFKARPISASGLLYPRVNRAISFTPSSYSIVPVANNINEGSGLTVTVSGINTTIANGTYYWTINNTTTADADFSAVSGSFLITSNTGSFTISPVADTTTEGAQTFTVSIRSTSISGTVLATSSTITINDTSITPVVPTYAVSPATGTVNEGSALTFNVTTTGVANATTLYWTVTNAGDFTTSSGSFTITSNAGSFSVTPTADTSTEGAETFTASVRTGSTSGAVVATSSSVTINDTSTTPSVFVPDYTITVTNSGNNYLLSGTARNGTFTSASQPALVFNNGDKVRFSVDAGTSSMHPFFIKTIQSTGTGNQVAAVSGGGTTTLEWTTNDTGAGSYGYQCSIHLGMWNTITIS